MKKKIIKIIKKKFISFDDMANQIVREIEKSLGLNNKVNGKK